MRKHRLLSWTVLCAATLMVHAASAKAPPGVGDGKPANPPGKPGDPPGKGKGPNDAEHGKPDGAKGAPGEADAAHGKDHEKGDKDKDDDKGKPGEAGGQGHGRGAMRELLAELKTGKLKKAEVQARLAKLHEDRSDREKEHREELKQRWGATLSNPSVREELEHHARRTARLNRALVLAETEVTKDRDKLKDRIQKLMDQENARHDRAMERFKSGAASAAAPGAASAAAAPGAASAAAPAASAASAAAAPAASAKAGAQ
jgi:hypothetical protein